MQINFSGYEYCILSYDICTDLYILKLSILENVEKYNKHIDIIKKLDGQRETILQANNDGKLMNEETKSEYEELKRKKNDIIKRDKKLAQLHEQYLDEYNSIIKKKEDIKEELDKINTKSKSSYNKK